MLALWRGGGEGIAKEQRRSGGAGRGTQMCGRDGSVVGWRECSPPFLFFCVRHLASGWGGGRACLHAWPALLLSVPAPVSLVRGPGREARIFTHACHTAGSVRIDDWIRRYIKCLYVLRGKKDGGHGRGVLGGSGRGVESVVCGSCGERARRAGCRRKKLMGALVVTAAALSRPHARRFREREEESCEKERRDETQITNQQSATKNGWILEPGEYPRVWWMGGLD